MSTAPFVHVGKTLLRKEDYRLLTGQGTYIDDIEIPGCLHACFVRSPYAHARIKSIAFSDALEMPGVIGVFTGKDLQELTTTLRMAPPIDGLKPMEMTALPVDKVLFQGDLVACIVAENRYIAEDALDRVQVEYEPLRPITNIEDATAPDCPLVNELFDSNLLSHQFFEHGDIQAAKPGCHKIIASEFSQHRQTHLPIETRGCIAVWGEGRQHMDFYVGAQAPHPYRTQLANRLRLTESQVTIHSSDVGGAFGQKIVLYREELTVAALSRKLNRPVRWREDRLENLLASTQSREDLCRTVVGVDEFGKIAFLELEMIEDFGAYCFYPGNYLARVVAMILTGPYKIQNYQFDVKVYLSNKVGNAPMRAPMAITSWVMEGTLDAIARELHLDPLEVRLINMVHKSDLPYTMPTGEVLADVTPRETLNGCMAAIDYADFRRRQMDARKSGKYLGLGICVVVESTTYGSKFYKSAGISGSGHEAVWIRIEPTGVINASVGLGPSGQGYETAFSQAVSEGLGVAPEAVRILMGNSDIAPYGMGSRGARGGTAGGGALYLCAKQAQERVLKIAACLLNMEDAGELRMVMGEVHRLRGGQSVPTGVSLKDIAHIAYLDPTRLPEGMRPGLEFHLTFDPPPMTYSNATHACEVEVCDQTGKIRIDRYVVAEDCGTVLNPQIVEGQQHGAIAMGLSGSLFEHVVYDHQGQNLSGTLADYLVATAHEIPTIEIIPMHSPNLSTPLGLKGMAEGGVMGAIGAISNAVNDALKPFGVVASAQPLSPMYIRSLIRQSVDPLKD